MATDKQWDRLKTEWTATIAISDLAEEIEESHGEKTPEAIAIRELERGFPLAVKSLVSLALHCDDVRVRRGAANDVINHNLALMQARKDQNPNADPLLTFIKSVTESLGDEAREQVQKTAKKSLPPVGSHKEHGPGPEHYLGINSTERED